MNGQSVTVGTFFGIQLRIHYSWLIVFGLVAWSIIDGYLPAYRLGMPLVERIFVGLFITFLFFVSVVCHEYAHSLVALRRGLPVKRITLFLFGGAAELQQEPKDAKTELLMTIAGPATSLVIAAVAWGIWAAASDLSANAVVLVAQPLALLNFAVGVFNLLPGYPLDGGRVLRAILWMRTHDIVRATRLASYTSYVVSYALMALGLVEIFVGLFVDGLWLLLIGFFLYQISRLSYEQTVSQKLLETVKVRDIMSDDFSSVPAQLSVSTFLTDYVLQYGQYDYLVADDGDAVGVIAFSRLVRLPTARQLQPVREYMTPLPKRLRLKPDDTADRALRLMRQHSISLLPVYDHSILTGVVTSQRMRDYLAIRGAEHDIRIDELTEVGT